MLVLRGAFRPREEAAVIGVKRNLVTTPAKPGSYQPLVARRSTFDNSPALPESLPDFNGCPSVNHEKIKRNKGITMFSGKKRESPKRRKTKEELLEELDMLRKEFEC